MTDKYDNIKWKKPTPIECQRCKNYMWEYRCFDDDGTECALRYIACRKCNPKPDGSKVQLLPDPLELYNTLMSDASRDDSWTSGGKVSESPMPEHKVRLIAMGYVIDTSNPAVEASYKEMTGQDLTKDNLRALRSYTKYQRILLVEGLKEIIEQYQRALASSLKKARDGSMDHKSFDELNSLLPENLKVRK